MVTLPVRTVEGRKGKLTEKFPPLGEPLSQSGSSFNITLSRSIYFHANLPTLFSAVYVNHIFNTCPSFDGHVAWLHFLVTVSIEAVNMDERMSVAGCRVLGMQSLLRRVLVLRNLLNRPHTAQETAPRINK